MADLSDCPDQPNSQFSDFPDQPSNGKIGKIVDVLSKIYSFPMKNPISQRLETGGENVSGAVTSIGERMMQKARQLQRPGIGESPLRNISRDIAAMPLGAGGAGVK